MVVTGVSTAGPGIVWNPPGAATGGGVVGGIAEGSAGTVPGAIGAGGTAVGGTITGASMDGAAGGIPSAVGAAGGITGGGGGIGAGCAGVTAAGAPAGSLSSIFVVDFLQAPTPTTKAPHATIIMNRFI